MPEQLLREDRSPGKTFVELSCAIGTIVLIAAGAYLTECAPMRRLEKADRAFIEGQSDEARRQDAAREDDRTRALVDSGTKDLKRSLQQQQQSIGKIQGDIKGIRTILKQAAPSAGTAARR